GPESDRGGVRVAARDVDGDGEGDLVTGAGVGSGARVRIYPGPDVLASPTPTPIVELDAVPGLTTGVYVAWTRRGGVAPAPGPGASRPGRSPEREPGGPLSSTKPRSS